MINFISTLHNTHVLSELLNISIKSGINPSKLKIMPIFRSDDKTDANNYKLVSSFSKFNRIFETIMYKRMTSYIEKHN